MQIHIISAGRFSNSDLRTQQFPFRTCCRHPWSYVRSKCGLASDKFSPEDGRAKMQQAKLVQTHAALDAHAFLQEFLLLSSYPMVWKSINEHAHAFPWPLGFFSAMTAGGKSRKPCKASSASDPILRMGAVSALGQLPPFSCSKHLFGQKYNVTDLG